MVVRQVLWPRSSVHDPFSAPHLQRKGECVLSALQSPTPLGRLKRWAVWGRLAAAGRALTRSKEWTSFKVGRRNRKLRACLKPVARGQGSRRQTAPQPPLYLLRSSSLYGGYHNSLQPPWMSQAGRCLRCRSVTSGQPSVVCWARQVYLGLLAATGFPGGENSARLSHLKLNVQSWLRGKQTSYGLCLIAYIWYESHGWTISKPFPSPPSHCY